MPFESKDLFSGAIITCDRVLQERDGALSAIRMFDVLSVQQFPIQIQVRAIILIKANGPSKKHLFEMSAEHPDGTIQPVTPVGEPLYIDFALRIDAPGSRPGAQIVMELGINATAQGTYILKALVDGTVVAVTGLTVLQPSPQSGESR